MINRVSNKLTKLIKMTIIKLFIYKEKKKSKIRVLF